MIIRSGQPSLKNRLRKAKSRNGALGCSINDAGEIGQCKTKKGRPPEKGGALSCIRQEAEVSAGVVMSRYADAVKARGSRFDIETGGKVVCEFAKALSLGLEDGAQKGVLEAKASALIRFLDGQMAATDPAVRKLVGLAGSIWGPACWANLLA